MFSRDQECGHADHPLLPAQQVVSVEVEKLYNQNYKKKNSSHLEDSIEKLLIAQIELAVDEPGELDLEKRAGKRETILKTTFSIESKVVVDRP